MKRTLLLCCLLLLSLAGFSGNILVKNIGELDKANNTAVPGDVIILQNGTWNNVKIVLTATGTKDRPITFKAQTAGQVIISGNAYLRIGGSYLVIDGLLFKDGYAGNNAVIEFRADKKQLANNCRVTNTAIESFNNPKRMDENYWVQFYGKRNRLDHCNFTGKLNMGVLLAVILDDERSRENFHSIDHNYFGQRLPLASNSGEIIRVGVSQHCEFNSNTQITDNFFEHCDGETEIVSIKSCSNIVRGNIFKECQGSVVLRHGNYNTVENNIFLGNKKAGTGGVRIINKGQWVVNNLFYECRGVGFRSPLSIMNGVPNSPAHRYVAVTEAVIANNSFVNSTPISLCEGSDTERSVIPSKVFFGRNIFYNNIDPRIYNAYDNINGITFATNLVSSNMPQELAPGFTKGDIRIGNNGFPVASPYKGMGSIEYDSVKAMASSRLSGNLPQSPGFQSALALKQAEAKIYAAAGAGFRRGRLTEKAAAPVVIRCADGPSLEKAMESHPGKDKKIWLTGTTYILQSGLSLNSNVTLVSYGKNAMKFVSASPAGYGILVNAGYRLDIDNIIFDLAAFKSDKFITTNVNGGSRHSNITIKNSYIDHYNGTFLYAAKSTICDSIIINANRFRNNKGRLFDFNNENDKKGYYNTEKLIIANNRFIGQDGPILLMLRGGNDESTMGPLLHFRNNKITDCNSSDVPLVLLNGTQLSFIEKNTFTSSSKAGETLRFVDAVRAVHQFRDNTFTDCGLITINKFTESKNNLVK